MVDNEAMELKTIQNGQEASRNDKGDENTQFKDVLRNFAENSTIAAVAEVYHHRISRFWKCVWYLVTLFGLCVAIYQAVALIKNYRKYPSFLTEMEKANKSLYFPSITLCPENTVNWKRLKEGNHSILSIIETEAKKLKEDSEVFDLSSKMEEFLMNEIYALDVAEHEEILSSIDDWLVMYAGNDAEGDNFFYPDKLKEIHTVSYSPAFGYCLTINPGLTEKSKLKMNTRNGMIILAKMNPEIEFPYLEESAGLNVIIHSPGTAPAISWIKQLFISPGEVSQLGIQVKYIQRLPSPYASHCFDKNQESSLIHEFSPYQSEETFYSYSTEECIAACIIKLTLQEKQCYLPKAPINESYKSLGYNLCSKSELDSYIVDLEKECSAKCPRPCRELLYYWTASSSPLTNRSRGIVNLLNKYEDAPVINLDNYIAIKLALESNTYIYIKETAKYELEDVFGSIGGNFGLWIGLTILSAFEIFELLTNIVAYFIRKSMKTKST